MFILVNLVVVSLCDLGLAVEPVYAGPVSCVCVRAEQSVGHHLCFPFCSLEDMYDVMDNLILIFHLY